MKPQIFTAFAKAQAFGLALGFALALHVRNVTGLSLGLFAFGAAGAWLAWEMLLGPRAPSARSDMAALSYGLLSGFAFPWVGLGLAALLAWVAA
jgi:hypothetical protein